MLINFAINSVRYLIKWFFITLIIGTLTGSASALFLLSLDFVTSLREQHFELILLLPVAGILIALLYHHWGWDVVKGNNVLLEEIDEPQKTVPLKMAPLVFAGTLLTHLFGGSAGREGTAVQMGGSIADQFTGIFNLDVAERKLILIAGISGGFASVFSTPIAGAVFAMEVLYIGKIRYQAAIPAFMAAFIAYYVCNLWPIHHTIYTIGLVPHLTLITVGWSVLAGICFGFAAKLFSFSMHSLTNAFHSCIKSPLLRPVLGGLIIVLFVFLT